MTDAISSFGTQLKMGDGATPTETFASIAELGDLDGPDESLATEEVTNHGSPNGRDEYIGTILSGGEVSFSLNWLPSQPTHAALREAMVSRRKTNFQLLFPDLDGYQFAALVTGIKPKAPVKGKLAADVKMRISGDVTEL